MEENLKGYNVPSSWNDFTLEHFIKIKELDEQQDQMDLVDFTDKYIMILTGLSKREVQGLNKYEQQDILTRLMLITKNAIESPEHPVFEYEGTHYVMDIREAKDYEFGEYVSLDVITKGQETWSIAHKLAAFFFRPATTDNKIEPFKYETLDERAELFYYKMPIPFIYASIGFFLGLLNQLNEISRP
jgi:hypothetical protein